MKISNIIMKQFKNLMLIGTSHIAKQSLNEVTNIINTNKPDIIALELDRKRYYALLQRKKNSISISEIRKIGLKGYIFAIIGSWIEKKLGDYVGVPPGSEMRQAVKLAKRNKIKIALIDQDIDITLKKLSKKITWRERWNFFVDLIKGLVLREKQVEFDLTKVPSQKIIDRMMKKVKERYPNIYSILVKERNYIMANNLKILIQQNIDKKIIAIIGAGHLNDIFSLIQK